MHRDENRVVILGGYGATGSRVARLLAARGVGPLVIAGRDRERAAALAEELVRAHPHIEVSAVAADARDAASMAGVLERARLVVVASSTSAAAGIVAHAAFAAGADYIDTQLSFRAKHEALDALRSRIEAKGACFVTDGGFHPGLPGALVRYAATRLDAIEEALVASVIRVDWRATAFSEATAPEMVQEFREHQPRVLKDGVWVDAGFRPRSFDFGAPWHRMPGYAMHLREMEDLPSRIPTLRATGFFVGGFDPVTDALVVPLVSIGARALPSWADRPLGALFAWSLRRGSKPPFGTMLRLEARRRGEPKPSYALSLAHEDAYDFTAIPVVATIAQMLEPTRPRGLWCQATFVNPERLLADVAALGVRVEEPSLQESVSR